MDEPKKRHFSLRRLFEWQAFVCLGIATLLADPDAPFGTAVPLILLACLLYIGNWESALLLMFTGAYAVAATLTAVVAALHMHVARFQDVAPVAHICGILGGVLAGSLWALVNGKKGGTFILFVFVMFVFWVFVISGSDP